MEANFLYFFEPNTAREAPAVQILFLKKERNKIQTTTKANNKPRGGAAELHKS
jgi:hypothetical protein